MSKQLQMELIKDQKGQGLTETAILLPVFLVMIFAVIEFYQLQEHLFKGHITARNMAWTITNKSNVLERLFEAAKSGDIQMDDLMDTNHGFYQAQHDTTTIILPRVAIDINYYVDRDTWTMDLSLWGMIKSLNKAFGSDKIDFDFL